MLKRLSHIFLDNWIAKIIVIVLAFGLWAFVVNTGYRSDVLPESISVTARDVPDTLAIASELPAVQVEVFAPTASFQRLKTNDIQAFVNTAGLSAGNHSLEIKVFADDPNVRVLEVTPPFLELTLENKRTDVFAINLETEGSLGQGFVADKAELSSQDVRVTGATSTIAAIAQVVVRLPLNGETGAVERTLTPVALNQDREELNNLSFSPEVIEVRLPVIQAEDAKSVGIEVDTAGQPAEGFFVGTISSDPSTTTAQGSSKALSEITTLVTETIDLSGATETIERTVKLITPDNVRAEPSNISIKIEIRPGSLTRTVDARIEATNTNLSASFSPASISITLRGPADKVRSAGESDVVARIDVASLGEGQHTLQLQRSQFGLDDQIEIDFVQTSVDVTLSPS